MEQGEDGWITVYNKVGKPQKFKGELIDRASTFDAQRRYLRWTDMELWRITEGPNQGAYVVYSIGCSVVYHDVKGCTNGSYVAVSTMDENSIPCSKCRPPSLRNLPGTYKVRMEDELETTSVCHTHTELIKALRAPKSTEEDDLLAISQPGLQLLTSAARTDKVLMEYLNTPEYI